jgi:hypothetical protein
VLSLDRLLDAALIDGRRAILGPHEPGGSLEAGAPADILTLDTARITADVLEDERRPCRPGRGPRPDRGCAQPVREWSRGRGTARPPASTGPPPRPS